jgi:hypothetical protein
LASGYRYVYKTSSLKQMEKRGYDEGMNRGSLIDDLVYGNL